MLEENMKSKTSITNLFTEVKANDSYLKVCAPMVRYSKVQFRTLVKNYGVDLCFTPMILADSFCQNAKARASEFSTTGNDSPLIAQFAANNRDDFVDAANLLYPYTDGVDLNCGCPQRWAIKDGYGCALLSKPEVIQDLVKGIRSSLPNDYSVSVKIRIIKDLKKTIELCRQLEKCGCNFLTVHGRTPSQKSGDNVDVGALKDVCQSVGIPIIANGGIKTLADSDELYGAVGCSGVMAASGILTNPALFSGVNRTPASCIKMWMDLKDNDSSKISFQCYHHHLVFMLEKVLNRQQKSIFNSLNTFEAVDEYVYQNIDLSDDNDVIVKYVMDDFITCDYADEITLKHSSKCRGCGKSVCYCICNKYDSNVSDGKFFTSYVDNTDALDFMDSNMFDI